MVLGQSILSMDSGKVTEAEYWVSLSSAWTGEKSMKMGIILGQSIFSMDRRATTAAASPPSVWTGERSLKLGTGTVHLKQGQEKGH